MTGSFLVVQQTKRNLLLSTLQLVVRVFPSYYSYAALVTSSGACVAVTLGLAVQTIVDVA